jgi:CDP-glucose 4,6-dehydratase
MTASPIDSDFWRGRTVLVTGAYGFLAGHLIEALLEAGAQVIGMVRDIPPTSYLQLSGNDARITLAPGDITVYDDCARLVSDHDCSVVFHIAAQAIVGAANRCPLGTIATNVIGTCNMLDACRQLNDTGRSSLIEAVVVASSDKAYGDQPLLPYTETAPLLGLHPYDASKSCADLLTRTYHNTYELPASVTRCSNLYGPGDLNMSRIVPDTICAVLNDTDPVIRSDGKPKRDYLYVGDAATAYLILAEKTASGAAAGQAYNIGTGMPLSVLELVEKIIEVSGKSGLKPDIQGTSWGEITHQYLDCAKAEAELGWIAATTVEDALGLTYDWYSDYLTAEGSTAR